MNLVRLSLFCVAALLVNGAYANDFTGSAGAVARTAELTLSNSQAWESRVGAHLQGAGSVRQPATRRAEDDGQWLRIADEGQTATANREPRPATGTPRWVF
ncbi:hypothetical protein ACJRW5_16370 [Pseudomonas sp. SH1-B]